MTKIVANPRGCCMEFHIRDGLIKEIDFLGKNDTERRKYLRKEEDKVKWGLSLTIQGDFEAFIKVLHEIKEDEKNLTYAKKLLASERKQWEYGLEQYQKKADEEKKQLQQKTEKEIERLKEIIDQYTWLE